MQETYHQADSGIIYIRHNTLSGTRTLLFIHGLGDSGLTFEPIFRYPQFEDFNILIPDLLGFGRSSAASGVEDYSFDGHLQRFHQLINDWSLDNLFVIGHSMGGDLGTLFCESDKRGIIKKFVNIEGAVTQYDLFISGKAVKADDQGKFDEWFKKFVDDTVYNQFGQAQSGRDYYASLRFCRSEAFRLNAREIVSRNTCLEGEYQSSIGEKFVSLKIPKVYCYGTRSLPEQTLKFLKMNDVNLRSFRDSGHCPMTDNQDQFYQFLYDFVSKEK